MRGKKALHYYHSLLVFPQRDSIHFAMHSCSALPWLNFRRFFARIKHITGMVMLECTHQSKSRVCNLSRLRANVGEACAWPTRRYLGTAQCLRQLEANLALLPCPAAGLLCLAPFPPENPALGCSFPLSLSKLFPPLQSWFFPSLPSTLTPAWSES